MWSNIFIVFIYSLCILFLLINISTYLHLMEKEFCYQNIKRKFKYEACSQIYLLFWFILYVYYFPLINISNLHLLEKEFCSKKLGIAVKIHLIRIVAEVWIYDLFVIIIFTLKIFIWWNKNPRDVNFTFFDISCDIEQIYKCLAR